MLAGVAAVSGEDGVLAQRPPARAIGASGEVGGERLPGGGRVAKELALRDLFGPV